MDDQMPAWPTTAPAQGSIRLRQFTDEDLHLALELGEDAYVPLIGSLPTHPTQQQALEWIERQRGRLAEGVGFSFVIADAETGLAVGTIGLWLKDLVAGRATAGYSVSPLYRGRGIATSALMALTTFAWTIEALHRVELYIEPWNIGSKVVRSRLAIGARDCCAVTSRLAGSVATCSSTRPYVSDRSSTRSSDRRHRADTSSGPLWPRLRALRRVTCG